MHAWPYAHVRMHAMASIRFTLGNAQRTYAYVRIAAFVCTIMSRSHVAQCVHDMCARCLGLLCTRRCVRRYEPCEGNYAQAYLNDPKVQAAIHAKVC